SFHRQPFRRLGLVRDVDGRRRSIHIGLGLVPLGCAAPGGPAWRHTHWPCPGEPAALRGASSVMVVSRFCLSRTSSATVLVRRAGGPRPPKDVTSISIRARGLSPGRSFSSQG